MVMFKKIMGYLLMSLGGICLLIFMLMTPSPRFRQSTTYLSPSSQDSSWELQMLIFYIFTPFLGFFFVWLGRRLLKSKEN